MLNAVGVALALCVTFMSMEGVSARAAGKSIGEGRDATLLKTSNNTRPTYRLGSGDKIRVTVFEEKDLSGKFEIGGEGEISLPLIGGVDALGKSIRELERDIADKLRDGFLKNPKVSIEVLNYRPFYILGEVEEPGSYPYVNGMTVLNAVALGGGFTHRAKREKITIIRAQDPDRTPITVSPETEVLPGDVVRIEERFF